jgi:hypothetical protein
MYRTAHLRAGPPPGVLLGDGRLVTRRASVSGARKDGWLGRGRTSAGRLGSAARGALLQMRAHRGRLVNNPGVGQPQASRPPLFATHRMSFAECNGDADPDPARRCPDSRQRGATIHAVGRVTRDGQQDFHAEPSPLYIVDHEEAVWWRPESWRRRATDLLLEGRQR